jgi:hypothetical protein
VGACDFICTAEGKNADEAFQAAIQSAKHKNGHNGYTGTVAEKNEFVMIPDSWKDLKAKYAAAVKKLNEVIRNLNDNVEADKYDKDEVEASLKEIKEVPIFLPFELGNTKTSALKVLRDEAKSLRALRDSCKPQMQTEELVNHLLFEVCDERVGQKHGPAGCIDLEPKLKGIKKPKKFLFFGWASS